MVETTLNQHLLHLMFPVQDDYIITSNPGKRLLANSWCAHTSVTVFSAKKLKVSQGENPDNSTIFNVRVESLYHAHGTTKKDV